MRLGFRRMSPTRGGTVTEERPPLYKRHSPLLPPAMGARFTGWITGARLEVVMGKGGGGYQGEIEKIRIPPVRGWSLEYLHL